MGRVWQGLAGVGRGQLARTEAARSPLQAGTGARMRGSLLAAPWDVQAVPAHGDIRALSRGQGTHTPEVFPSALSAHGRFPLSPLAGTPTEDTWPGITSNEEFKAYNFTQYRAQPLINHAPRYPWSRDSSGMGV